MNFPSKILFHGAFTTLQISTFKYLKFTIYYNSLFHGFLHISISSLYFALSAKSTYYKPLCFALCIFSSLSTTFPFSKLWLASSFLPLSTKIHSSELSLPSSSLSSKTCHDEPRTLPHVSSLSAKRSYDEPLTLTLASFHPSCLYQRICRRENSLLANHEVF